jgi:Ca2+-binding RTX toxin-like protein
MRERQPNAQRGRPRALKKWRTATDAAVIVSPMRRLARLLVLVAAPILVVGGLSVPALAATCDFSNGAVTVDVGAGETATIGTSASAITLDGTPCSTATVNNTDTIAVTTAAIPNEIAFDLTGGPLGPGLTPEADGSEIEITVNAPNGTPTLRVVGSAGADHIVAGQGGVNLNADETTADADITITGTPALVVEGRDGDDVLSLGGGAGTGTAGPPGRLLGGLGNDELGGGPAASTYDGGEGTDRVDYTGATSLEEANLSTGQVIHEGGGVDMLVAIEEITGSPGDDRFVGSTGDDAIDGGDGSDTIDYEAAAGGVQVDLAGGTGVGDGTDQLDSIENVVGSPGDDVITGNEDDNVLEGGAGLDTVSFAGSNAAVDVNLKKGTATGQGTDELIGFEDVDGSRKKDVIRGDAGANVLDGGAGADELYGGNGADVVLGSEGADLLFGQKGRDLLKGGGGKDQLNGGEGRDTCKGGEDPDAFVLCEKL